jgi:peptidoglycan/xylan/chitin deacetylase (PgdA/CDA1 family)
VPPNSPPRRYQSSTYAGAELAARREAARRRLRRRRLVAAAVAVVVVAAIGAAVWAFAGSSLGSGSAGGSGPPGGASGGDEPSPTGADGDGPSSSPSPSPTASSSPTKASPKPAESGAAGAFTGTYVPILMYHRIEDTAETGNNSRYFSTPHKFKQQMRVLDYHGYTAVTLTQVWDYWHGEGELPAKPIVLTFDDGTSGIAENAGPVLKKYGWPGVLFPVVPNINDDGGSLSLTPEQVRRLIADGWELGSHSMSHPNMTTVSASRLQYEAAESRRRLQEQFDVPVNFFCYPGGAHDTASEAAVEAAGYLGATTVVRGCADPDTPYALDRIEVDGRNVMKTFLRDLEYWQQHP